VIKSLLWWLSQSVQFDQICQVKRLANLPHISRNSAEVFRDGLIRVSHQRLNQSLAVRNWFTDCRFCMPRLNSPLSSCIERLGGASSHYGTHQPTSPNPTTGPRSPPRLPCHARSEGKDGHRGVGAVHGWVLGACRRGGYGSKASAPNHRHRMTAPRIASSTKIPMIATATAILARRRLVPRKIRRRMTREPKASGSVRAVGFW